MAFTDLFVWGFLLFACAVIILSNWLVLEEMGDLDVVNQNYTMNGTTINPYETGVRYMSTFDWGFLFIALGLTLAMFYSGYLLPSHPIFTGIGFLVAIMWLLVAPMFSNVFYGVVHNTILSQVADRIPLTYNFMLYLPVIGLMVGVVSNILTYGKGVGQR